MIFAIAIVFIYSPLAWVRKISKFSIAFIIGNFLILSTCIVIIAFCFSMMAKNGIGKGLVAYDISGFWTTIGFSIYVYEGIGVVMPIM